MLFPNSGGNKAAANLRLTFVTTLATGTFARLKLNKYLVFILYSFSRYAPSLAKHKWCKLVLPKYYPYCDHTLVQVSLPIYLPIYGNLSASCPTQNRVCNAYAGYNLTLLQDPLFLYNASTLQLAYLPAFVSSLYVQTLCAVAGLHLVDHWQAIQASTNRYSIGVIPCYEQVGVFLATIQLDIGRPARQGAQPGARLRRRARERAVLRGQHRRDLAARFFSALRAFCRKWQSLRQLLRRPRPHVCPNLFATNNTATPARPRPAGRGLFLRGSDCI